MERLELSKEKNSCELSLVIPLFNEAQNIQPLYYKLKAVLDRINMSYEIVMIDDGSKDDTLSILKKIRQSDRRLKIISFRKNFGQGFAGGDANYWTAIFRAATVSGRLYL